MISANTGHVMMVANSIIGVGILAMPFCFQKCGVVLSILLLVVSNIVTRLCCHYLIKSSHLTRRKSFEFLAFHAFGSSGKLMVELCIIGYLIGTCIAYFVVVGDLGPQIVAKLLNIDLSDSLRTWVMVTVTSFGIIPLAMLKNVDSLAAVCTASIGFYFCLVIKVIAESKAHIVANDWMEQIEYWKPSGTLQCLPIFSMALSCQMQLFEVLETVSNASLEKMNKIVKSSTMICMWVYVFVGFFGYVAFCTQPFAGNILLNFSPSLASDVIKMGFVLSVAFSFPLVIFPCRASIYSLLYRRGHADATGYIPELRFKVITLSIVLFSLGTALIIPSIELVIGLVGSTIGVVICIMFPASCFVKVCKKDSTEKRLAQFILICGFCLMILGTYANLNAIDEKRSGPVSVVDEQKEVEKAPSLQKLPDSFKPTELHQAEKPITANLPPKAFIREERPSNKSNQEKEINLLESAKKDPVKVITQNITKTVIKPQSSEIKESLPVQVTPNSIDINKDAIKKDEDMAAEETQKQAKELNKAEAELKKTKELLEKKVDELKEQLKQQNEETKNFMQEKLGNIAEKVEKIEREVHKEGKKDSNLEEINEKSSNKEENKETNETPEVVKQIELENSSNISKIMSSTNQTPPPIPKGSLVKMLTENLKEKQKQSETNNSAFEPLSYKTGEIMNKIKEAKADENKPPLPLPLLMNVSIPKTENIAKVETVKPPTSSQNPESANQNRIESIRRDILQANSDSDPANTKSLGLENYRREKRNAAKESCVNWDVELDDCLDKKSVDTMVPQRIANLESIGRDLKSVKEKT